MHINLVAYGIAKDILKGSQLDFKLDHGSRIKDLKTALMNTYPRFKDLRSLRFAVGEAYQADDFELKEEDEVVIIPPVSGG